MTSLTQNLGSSSHSKTLPALSQPLAPNVTTNFEGAYDFEVNDCTFNEVAGNQIIYEASASAPLSLLYKSISPGASHDSEERYPAPKCHEKTRQSVINEIVAWIGDAERERRLCWLNGAPGVGKSAIAQSVSEYCAEKKQLAGSFFFSRESQDRKSAKHLFLTLAYQISVAIPSAKRAIAKEINDEEHILSKSLNDQLDRLILRPLSCLFDLQPMVIVIDGLDECDVAGQQLILGLFGRMMSGLPRSFCLLISSRPESLIDEAISVDLRTLSRRVTLDARYAPDRDIETFLRIGLSQQQVQRHFSNHGTSPWPQDSDIKCLVAACAGQFLCAATIIHYIDKGPHRPDAMLKNLLGTNGLRHAPFTSLDDLYIRVMGMCLDPTKLLSILGIILVSSCQIGFIEALLGLESGDVVRYLRGFDSVLHIPRQRAKNQSIRIRHPSFRDFLMDRTRSGQYFIDIEVRHAQVATCMLLAQRPSNMDHPLLGVSLDYWAVHCAQAAPTEDLINALEENDLQLWLKNSSGGPYSYSTTDLVGVMAWLGKHTSNAALKIIHARWMKICYDVFYADLTAFDLRPHDCSADVFLALTVIASIAKHLNLDTSIARDVLEPFVTEPRTLWFTLDARIGVRSPFEPWSQQYCHVAEHIFVDLLSSWSEPRNTICLDAWNLKGTDGTVLARFDLEHFNSFGRFTLNAAQCHTHFALACLAYVSKASSHLNLHGVTRLHACESRAYEYAKSKWAYHLTQSIPTAAVMVNLRDFIHIKHAQRLGSANLILVISWLKNVDDPPLKLIACWESALRKTDCKDSHNSRRVGTQAAPTPPQTPSPPLLLPTPSPSPPHERELKGSKSKRKFGFIPFGS